MTVLKRDKAHEEKICSCRLGYSHVICGKLHNSDRYGRRYSATAVGSVTDIFCLLGGIHMHKYVPFIAIERNNLNMLHSNEVIVKAVQI